MPHSAKLTQSSDATVPAKKGDLCVSFHIKLLLESESFEPEANEKFPRQWMGQIGLHFTLPGSYPLTHAPLVSVTTGKLTLSDGFSDSKIASLEEAVRQASAGGESAEGGGCIGEACGMLCMQAANDWFSSGQWLPCGIFRVGGLIGLTYYQSYLKNKQFPICTEFNVDTKLL